MRMASALKARAQARAEKAASPLRAMSREGRLLSQLGGGALNVGLLPDTVRNTEMGTLAPSNRKAA